MATMREPSNREIGERFQKRVAGLLAERFDEEFALDVEIPIGTPPKGHRFDVVSRSRSVICECKANTWTVSGNVPSAKISTLREAVSYLTQVPGPATRVLALARATARGRTETLGEYFVRLNENLLGDVVVLDVAPDAGDMRPIRGDL
jgi:hypothetical protein